MAAWRASCDVGASQQACFPVPHASAAGRTMAVEHRHGKSGEDHVASFMHYQ